VSSRTVLELVEYENCFLDASALTVELGERLWRTYSAQIDVDFPSPKIGNQWLLKPQGWVGHIPLATDFAISLSPKVPLGRLFEMLEVAYRLRSFRFLEGLTDCASISAYYDRLARVLAKRVLDRGRRGYYREYVGERRQLPYICGRMDIQAVAQMPWRVRVPCEYEQHTGDIVENQILTWTLSRVSRSSDCNEETLRVVRQAYRELSGIAPAAHIAPSDCVGRLYNRLNDDYEPLHALCRFFLEQAGPTHEVGDMCMLPFLVDMARLFELFVSEWLQGHLPPRWMLRSQENVTVDAGSNLVFCIDLVLIDGATGRVAAVIDTKYKAPEHPSTDDLQQIIAYAVSQECDEAVLIYPRILNQPIDEYVGGIHVRSLSFCLDGDLDSAGRELLNRLVGDIA